MAFIPQYYPNMYYGGYHSMYNPRWNPGHYQFGGNMGNFFNYFKGIYPNILGYQGQSDGQSNLYSDDAQKYYKDLINRNSAYDNYTNKDAYFQDNPYDPLGGLQIGNWQSQGIPGFYEAMNTNFDQQQSRIDDFVDKDAKWADKIAASMQADLDTRRDEWDNKTGNIFNEAKTNQIMETGANIFSLMRGQEEYDNALKEDPLTLTNTGFKGFKYQLGGRSIPASTLQENLDAISAPKPVHNFRIAELDTMSNNQLYAYIASQAAAIAEAERTLAGKSFGKKDTEADREYQRMHAANIRSSSMANKQMAELIMNQRGKPKMQLGGTPFKNLINTTGYTRGTNTFNNPFNIIPGGNITMKNVDEPILAMPSQGKPIVMEPGKDYNFPGASYVIEKRLNTMKNGGRMNHYQFGSHITDKYLKGQPVQFERGFLNPFISAPQSDLNTRLYIQQMAGNQTQPAVTPVQPIARRSIGLVPSHAMNMQGYIDGVEMMYNNNPANADDQIARSRYKDDGTKDKRYRKHYLKSYGQQVQTLGLSNRDDVKEIQKAMGMTGKEVDGIWGPKTQMAFDLWNTNGPIQDPAAYQLSAQNVSPDVAPPTTLQPTVTDQYGNVATRPDLTPEQQAMWDYNFDRTVGIAGKSLVDGLSAGYVAKNPYVGAGVGLLSAAEQGLIGTNVVGSAANLAAMGRMGVGAVRVAGKAIPKGTKLATGLYQGTKNGLVTLSKGAKKQFVDKGSYLMDETGAVFTKAGKKIKNGTAASRRAVQDFFKKGKSIQVQEYEKNFTDQSNLAYGLYRDSKGRIQKIKDTRGGLQKILQGDFKNPFKGAQGYTRKPKKRSSNPTNYNAFFRYGGEVTFENPFK